MGIINDFSKKRNAQDELSGNESVNKKLPDDPDKMKTLLVRFAQYFHKLSLAHPELEELSEDEEILGLMDEVWYGFGGWDMPYVGKGRE